MVKKVVPEKDLKPFTKTNELNLFFENTLKDAVDFIERNQLYDVALWKNFVDIFRVQDDGAYRCW